MKKIFIHLIFAFFVSNLLFFTGASYAAEASAKEVTASKSAVALQSPAALNSTDLQSAKARMEGDVQLEFKQGAEKPQVSANIFFENWGIITLSFITFLEGIVRLTPSEKDNSILRILTVVLNVLIPNLKKGGGTH